jgi:DNA-binding NarL/FixJ family response regulator
MIRVLICDDQAIVCDGLEAILSTDSEIEVVGLASNGAQAVELAQSTKPDLVLMDLKMPGMNGCLMQFGAAHAQRYHRRKTHVDPVVAELSDREREVLQMLTHGLSNTEIAQKLHLSDGTVRNYVSALFVKLGVSDRTQAAVLALRYGLVD